jgi:chromosome segregation ATPase
MKTLKMILLLALISSMFGCKNKKEAEQLSEANRYLTIQAERCDSILNDYRSLVYEIEAELNKSLPEGATPEEISDLNQLRARISGTIANINTLMKESEQRAQTLRNRNYNVNSRVSEMESEMDSLNIQIRERDSLINVYNQQIAELNSNIEERDSKISELNTGSTQLNTELEQMTNRMHTAYFISGSEDELREQDIILKTGGFLGFLGRVNKLNPQLDANDFETIDVREKTSFAVSGNSDKLEFISQHPSGSYDIESVNDDSATINVTDPDKFWQVTKFLVVAE